jgi:hypothetical protein
MAVIESHSLRYTVWDVAPSATTGFLVTANIFLKHFNGLHGLQSRSFSSDDDAISEINALMQVATGELKHLQDKKA